jgi:formylmethanofuran dehydrogenase subunit E
MTNKEVKASTIADMKADMLKMMDKLDKHEMYIKQLNWKIDRKEETIKTAMCSECDTIVKNNRENTIPICKECEDRLRCSYN